MNVPMIDPSLFMERFSAQLDLGEESHKQPLIASTAVRIVQQMKRDWLQEGRRPTGLCGAALLVALRCHGVTKTPEEVAGVVRMAESTLRIRLYEMRSTSVAGRGWVVFWLDGFCLGCFYCLDFVFSGREGVVESGL